MKLEFRRAACITVTLLIVLTLCFIFGNSLLSRDDSAEQSGRIVKLLKPILDPNDRLTYDEFHKIVRKTAHFVEYAALGFECALLAFFVNSKLRSCGAIYSAGGCLLAADIDEYIQLLVDRGSAVSDVLLDFCGAVFGIAVSFTVVYIILKIKDKKRSAAE